MDLWDMRVSATDKPGRREGTYKEGKGDLRKGGKGAREEDRAAIRLLAQFPNSEQRRLLRLSQPDFPSRAGTRWPR